VHSPSIRRAGARRLLCTLGRCVIITALPGHRRGLLRAQAGAVGEVRGRLESRRPLLSRTLGVAHHQTLGAFLRFRSVTKTNIRGVIGGSSTRKVCGEQVQWCPQRTSLSGGHIIPAAVAVSSILRAFLWRRPNLAVKRTYPGGAHLRAHRASSAPVYAAYFVR
jgi:hypothetical protein